MPIQRSQPQSVRTDCLSLFKAYLTRKHHNPSQFLRSKQIKTFVDKLSAMQNCTAVKVINGGLNHGVWALELVVIRYATWLKHEFEILVYNTFKDAARKGLDVMTKLNK
ncbi:KilA-N domain-containing protein, partial [Providencia sp. 504mA]|nr:KilA-N domain-containing protein [Providencia rettgeri]NIB00013.1 KilA-N domain-containing protein [Providencia rettgeri]NIB17830.1 KilA-N domain-containing protein [Providencia rettgeri]NIB37923.1 KilA-N domain-containing protein [Providencia rettgeri]NIL73908.1 KilA-N domain-containing protein [Providencia sp. 504mA]